MSKPLGFGTTLDPDTIQISHHALKRYCERRGIPIPCTSFTRRAAEDSIRDLLRRCVTQRPPAAMIGGHKYPTRRYKTGDLAFVVTADHTVVITMYVLENNSKKRDRKRRKAQK